MYDTFLFLHILGVIVWIGGALTLTMLNLRLAREPSPDVRQSLSRAGEFFGRTVFGPAAALTLIAGIVLIGLTGWMTPAWVIWGLCGVFGSGFIGAVFLSRASQALTRTAAENQVDAPALIPVRRRLTRWSLLNLAVLVSAVWAMVFKPVL